MDWTAADRTAAYKLFKQKVMMYFDCKEVKKEKQVSYILLMTGDEGLKMFNSWGLSDTDSKDPDKVWEKFDTHIEPKSSFRVERLTFQRMRQRAEESSDDFVSRLTNQANLCKFKDCDERIVEQITFGTKHSEVQKALLMADETCALAKAIETCRIYDASVTHQQAFRSIAETNQTSQQVHAIQRQGYKSSKACYSCGEQRHKSHGCPAKGATCHKCGGKDHWAKARACPRRDDADSDSNDDKKERQSYRRRRGYDGGHKRRSVHTVQYLDSSSDDSDQQDFHSIHFDSITEGSTTPRDHKSAMTNLLIQLPGRQGNDSLRLKVDTGAEGNIIPLRTYRQMFPKNLDAAGYPMPHKTHPEPHRTLRTYNGGTLRQFGSVVIKCRSKGSHWQNVKFFIAEAIGPAILGLTNSKSLGIVSIADGSVPQGTRPTQGRKGYSSKWLITSYLQYIVHIHVVAIVLVSV